jgi:NADP-dependent 3-hydroxy acid dehydrogenase YdfG
MGAATALLLAARGAKVVLGARGLDRLEALAARIADAGGEVAHARTDVRQRDDLEAKAQVVASMDKFAMPPDAIARAIAFAIEQPADVDVGEIIVRATAQS